jgi:hypothetical protein
MIKIVQASVVQLSFPLYPALGRDWGRHAGMTYEFDITMGFCPAKNRLTEKMHRI